MFEKARFEFSKHLTESENERDQILETKAKFLFSLATLILAGLIIKLDLISDVIDDFEKTKNESLELFLFGQIFLVATGLLFSIFCVFKVIWLRKYKSVIPQKPLSTLYSPDTNFYDGKEEKDFYDSVGQHFLTVLEANNKVLTNKAKWVRNAWIGLLITVTVIISIFIFWTIIKLGWIQIN
jgi:hypothetical protein